MAKNTPPTTENRLAKIAPAYERNTISDADVLAMNKKSNLDPLSFLLAVMRDERLPIQVRVGAAKDAIPFTHQKKPIAVEGTDKPFILESEHLRNLSKKDLDTLQMLLSKTGVALAESSATSH